MDKKKRRRGEMKASVIASAVLCRVKKILMGYAQVFFCTRWEVGLIFFIATFIVPSHGISGLLGILASNLTARLLGMQEDHIEEGYYAYNGLLTGLALGMTYRFNAAFAAMLLLSSVLGVFIAAVLRKFSERYLFIPVLSLPFVITAWIAMAAGQNFGELIYATKPFEIDTLKGVLPLPVEQ
ncbi:MAG: urea transporter, partial [Spirochaetes bacterium]|nr:urea transporter [Spirochaetota bacterium]